MPVSKIISTNYNSTRTKGTIQSLYDKELNYELVDSSSPWELGAFIYNYNRTGLSECRIIDSSNGPIYQRILLQGKSPGTDEAFGVNLEIKLYHDTKRIELEYAIKRLPETEPSGIYVAFPFQLPEGKLAFDVQGGTVISGKNQLEGTSTDWNTVQNFVSVQNNRAANYYRKQPHPPLSTRRHKPRKISISETVRKASCLLVGDE